MCVRRILSAMILLCFTVLSGAQQPPATGDQTAPGRDWVQDKEKLLFKKLFGEAPSKWRYTEYDPKPDADAQSAGELILPMPCGGAMVFRQIVVGGGQSRLAEQKIELGSQDQKTAPIDSMRTQYIAGTFGADVQNSAVGRYYYLGKYEVTELQYRVLQGQCPEKLKGRRPVVGVSWYDAVDFTRRYTEWLYQNFRNKLPKVDGIPGFLRLPTEVEWEFAARGGVAVGEAAFRGKLFPMGAQGLENFAWFRESVSSSFKPRPVGSLASNPLGLYDVLGNAAELVLDLFHLGGRGRMHAQAGGLVVKGGHFRSWRSKLRTSWRQEYPHFSAKTGKPTRLDTVGFRLVISAPILTSKQGIQLLREAWQRQPDDASLSAGSAGDCDDSESGVKATLPALQDDKKQLCD